MTAADNPRTGAARLRRWRGPLWGGVVTAAIAAAGLAGFALGELRTPAQEAPLPVIRPSPSYVLTDQLGRSVSSASFLGKVQIVTFLDPYCTDVCPLVAAHLVNFENLAARPARIADKIAILTFNLDPENAGPAQLRAFLRQYGWNPDDLHWRYLTGAPDTIRRVVRDGFAVAYEEAPPASEGGEAQPRAVEPQIVNRLAQEAHRGYDIAHSNIIEIIDRRGRVRKVFTGADTVAPFALLKVVEALLGGDG